MAPLLDGLAAVHRAGYLHRDIKPDNIYVRDEDGSLVLLDFGAARQAAYDSVETGAVVTPGYGAARALRGRRPPGAVDRHLLDGRHALLAHRRQEARSRPPAAWASATRCRPRRDLGRDRYSVAFLEAIDWALRLQPGERPADVEQWRAMLFSAHPAALGLQAALAAGDPDAYRKNESWYRSLHSPRALKARIGRAWDVLRRPASWPLSIKMTIAMVGTALAPMIITAQYNLQVAADNVRDVELRNLEHLAQSTAGRVSQLLDDSRNLANYLGTDDDFVAYLAHPTPAGTEAIVSKLNGLVKADPTCSSRW